MKINIAEAFTDLPGPRYRRQGEGSGQEFREDHLVPAFSKAIESGEKLVIQLDGVRYGYPTSFLEEAFGGLAREFGIEEVQDCLLFESGTEPLLDKEIRHYIKYANDTSGGRSRIDYHG